MASGPKTLRSLKGGLGAARVMTMGIAARASPRHTGTETQRSQTEELPSIAPVPEARCTSASGLSESPAVCR